MLYTFARQYLLMTYNLNGKHISGKHLAIGVNNRGLNYGDGIFETIKYANNRLNFWEDHYFRLMASMRIVRMEIPMSFSPDFLEDQIRGVLKANDLEGEAARIKLLCIRKQGGFYTPETNDIDYLISAVKLLDATYQLNERGLEIDLYKDFFKPAGLLSNLKSTSAQLYSIASVFKKENGLDECILLNAEKQVVEAISSNIFMVQGKELITPPLASGCLKGVMRKQIINMAAKLDLTVKEEVFSPFQLQKADEIFLTNSIKGLQWVRKYRKKEYGNEISAKLTKRLNVEVALGGTAGQLV